jgi:hypothetical protein
MQPYSIDATGFNLRIAGGGTATITWIAEGVKMGYLYRAMTGGFYNEDFEAEYRKAGTWPGFTSGFLMRIIRP